MQTLCYRLSDGNDDGGEGMEGETNITLDAVFVMSRQASIMGREEGNIPRKLPLGKST